MRKAQIFSMELVIVISIFLMLITSSVMLWDNNVNSGEKAALQKSMQTKAFSAADLLARGTEIADEPNVVSIEKTNLLFNRSYQDLRSSLAIAPYEFYLKAYCLNQSGSYCNGFSSRTIGSLPSQTSEVVVTKRIAKSGNDTMFIEFYVWSETSG